MRPAPPSTVARLAPPLAVVITVVIGFGAALYPLTGTLGWEAAQILGATLGPLMLIVGAIRGASQRERGFLGDIGVQAATAGIAAGLFLAIIAFAGLSHESCAPSRGFLPFVFFSLPVVALHSAVGPWIGRLLGNVKFAISASILLVVGLLLWLFLTWAWDPSFRVLSHFFVVVDGDLLAGRPITGAAVGFRFATFLFAAAVTFMGLWRFPVNKRSGLSSGASGGPNAALFAAVAFALVGVVAHMQSRSAIAPSRATMEETYALERTRGDLIVRADPLVHDVREVEGILAEGTLWLKRLKSRMGVSPSAPITIWLHKDRKTLGKWTGAEHVHFALPGQRELHITHAEVPHRSLGHELAHVLGREIADNFLGVPTSFFILINAGITEGTAMAVTPELEARRELTLDQEAAALRRANMAPDIRALFNDTLSSFRFWQEAPGRSYVTAGSLMNALRAEKGVEGLAKVYREASLSAAFDSADALEAFIAGHEKRLDAMELPKDALGAVSRRHRKASILNQTCDSGKISAARSIRSAAFGGDFARAETLAKESDGELLPETFALFAEAAARLELDSRELDAWVKRAGMAPADEDVRGKSERMDDAADALWRAGRRRQAAAYWGRTDASVLSPGRHRAVVVKRLLANEIDARAGQAPVSAAAMELLTTRGKSPDQIALVGRLAQTLATPSGESALARGLARYILARQFTQRGLPDAGVMSFLEVWASTGAALPPAIAEQTLVGLAIAHARRGDLAIAAAGFQSVAEKTERAATRVRMRDYEERARRAAAARASSDESIRGDALLLGLATKGAY